MMLVAGTGRPGQADEVAALPAQIHGRWVRANLDVDNRVWRHWRKEKEFPKHLMRDGNWPHALLIQKADFVEFLKRTGRLQGYEK